MSTSSRNWRWSEVEQKYVEVDDSAPLFSSPRREGASPRRGSRSRSPSPSRNTLGSTIPYARGSPQRDNARGLTTLLRREIESWSAMGRDRKFNPTSEAPSRGLSSSSAGLTSAELRVENERLHNKVATMWEDYRIKLDILRKLLPLVEEQVLEGMEAGDVAEAEADRADSVLVRLFAFVQDLESLTELTPDPQPGGDSTDGLLGARMASIKRKVASLAQDTQELQRDLMVQEAELSSTLRRSSLNLSNSVKEAQNRYASYEARIEELTNQLENERSISSVLTRQVSSLRDDLARTEIEDARAISSVSAEADNLEDEVEKLADALDSEKAVTSILSRQLEAAREQLDNSQAMSRADLNASVGRGSLNRSRNSLRGSPMRNDVAPEVRDVQDQYLAIADQLTSERALFDDERERLLGEWTTLYNKMDSEKAALEKEISALRLKNNEMRVQHETEIIGANSRRLELEDRIKALRDRLSSTQDSLAMAEANIRLLTDQLANSGNKNRALLASLEEERDRIGELQETVEGERQRNADLAAANTSLTSDLGDATRQVNVLKAQGSTLQGQLDESRNLCSSIQAQFDELMERMHSERAQAAHKYNAVVERHAAEVDALQAENERLRVDMNLVEETSERRLEELNAAFSADRQQATRVRASLEAQISTLVSEVEAGSVELARARETQDRISREVERVSAERIETIEELAAARDSFAKKESMLQRLLSEEKATASEASRALSALRDRHADVSARAELLQKEKASLEATLTAVSREASNAESRAGDAETQLAIARQTSANLSAEVMAVNEQLNSTVATLKTTQTLVAAEERELQDEISRANDDRVAAQETERRLRAELTAQQQTFERQISKIRAEYEDEISRVRNRLVREKLAEVERLEAEKETVERIQQQLATQKLQAEELRHARELQNVQTKDSDALAAAERRVAAAEDRMETLTLQLSQERAVFERERGRLVAEWGEKLREWTAERNDLLERLRRADLDFEDLRTVNHAMREDYSELVSVMSTSVSGVKHGGARSADSSYFG